MSKITKSKYVIHEIESVDKYSWQEEIKKREEYTQDDCGLSCIYSRTGSGKTKVQYNRMKYYKSIGKKSVTIYVPYSTRTYLPIQIFNSFKKYLNKDNQLYTFCCNNENDGLEYSIHIGNFKCDIKPLLHSTKSLEYLLDDHDFINPLCIDEFDAVQTQFGLNHGGSLDNYAKSKLRSHVKVFEKNGNNLLERLCNRTHVNAYTASFDEILTSDLLPYVGKFPITVYTVKHKEESYEKIPFKFKSYKDMKNKLIEKYHEKEKSFVYVTRKQEMDKLKMFLRANKINDFYSWHCKSGKSLNSYEIENNLISIFVNGATRGLDLSLIKNIFIFRKLNASTKQDKASMSALLNQISGRIRKEGTIYRESSVLSPGQIHEDRFGYEEKNIEKVLSNKIIYEIDFFRELNQRKQYDNDYKNNIVRLFIYRFLSEFNIESKIKHGDSIKQRIRNKLNRNINNRYDELIFLCHKINNNLLKHNDIIFTKYIKCEKKLMVLFIKAFNSLMIGREHIFSPNKSIYTGDRTTKPDISESKTKKSSEEPEKSDSITTKPDISESKTKRIIIRTKKSDSRTTGGGTAKPNISESEKKKSLEALKKATSNYGGNSVLIKEEYSDEVNCGFMHAKAKSKLDKSQRPKCIYAIPMFSTLESGMNQKDIHTKLLIFDDITKRITVNYEYIKNDKFYKADVFRPEKEINDILEIYHKELTKLYA